MSTGLVVGNVSGTLVNSIQAATSSVLDLMSGVTTGGLGYQSPGSVGVKIGVGPNDRVAMFATAFYSTGVNVGVTSCTYDIIWQR